jgi:uncharacterized protein (DUF342 family)
MSNSFEKLREALRGLKFEEHGEGRPRNQVEVDAGSVEECLQKAGRELGVSISELEYEILERGKRSFLGGKPFRLLVSVSERLSPLGRVEYAGEEPEAVDEEFRNDFDGSFKVKITRLGVMLKVDVPKGRGQKVRIEDVLVALSERGIREYDKTKVAKVVRNTSGEYAKIAEWVPDEKSDGKVNIEVSEDEMRAFMTLIPPRPRGRSLDIDDIMEALHHKGVVVGIKEEAISKALEDEAYNSLILIAEGVKPKSGEDSKVIFNFRTEKKVQLEEDEKGQVDFKDLDLVENVVAGQLLATKIPATEGREGRTITNKILPEKSGKENELVPGKNTELSPDGMNIIATINGQVVLANGKVNVEPVFEVKGNVDMHTGNILFLGTVIVRGNVEDGFSIKAAGDIEIKGSVGKCLLDSEGDIHIKQGVMGKLGGTIKSGGAVWAKFLEQVHVVADKSVFVQDGIMHCQVDATEKVICFGKRATIVGGRIRAGEIVNTKTLGSVSFTETIVEVGIDPKSRQRLYDLEKEKAKSEEAIEKLVMNISTLENQQKMKRAFTEEKQQLLEKMLTTRDEVTARLGEIKEEMEELRSYLKLLKTIGNVSVSKNVYPGVKIGIKDVYYDVKNEFKYVTMILDGGRIRIKKYEDVTVEEIIGKRLR